MTIEAVNEKEFHEYQDGFKTTPPKHYSGHTWKQHPQFSDEFFKTFVVKTKIRKELATILSDQRCYEKHKGTYSRNESIITYG